MADNWSEEELKAAVEAYVDMRLKESKNEPFVKKGYYIDLAERWGRTAKSYEFRMQNISYVYSLLGRSWVAGVKPAKHVGPRNVAIIERLIGEVEGWSGQPVAEFESTVQALKSRSSLDKPSGSLLPAKSESSISTFVRDPAVKAWVLKEADGVCECCSNPAPFVTVSGEPYLEVHHLRRLADRGSDKTTNAVALCPNCHRELHYGVNRDTLKASMYTKIKRLAPE